MLQLILLIGLIWVALRLMETVTMLVRWLCLALMVGIVIIHFPEWLNSLETLEMEEVKQLILWLMQWV